MSEPAPIQSRTAMPAISRDAAMDFMNRHGLARRGAPLPHAKAVLILLHGRGATAEGILDLADALAMPDIAYLAPQAMGNTWYPYSFLAPMQQNEPHLSRALKTGSDILGELIAMGVPPEKIGVLGFSQGACLALETVARNPRAYGAVIALSGGLIGPPGTPRDYAGTLAGANAFLGCSDIDSHIPLERVEESDAVFKRMGATVKTRIYPGFGHGINADEMAEARTLLARMQS